MVKKQIQKHDFLSGGPVLQYGITFNSDFFVSPGVTNLGQIGPTIYNFIPQIRLVDDDGNNIFNVDEDGVTYRDQPLVTENRLREIVREIMDNHLRGE